MKKIATRLKEWFVLPNPGLRAFLRRNETGSNEVFTTPLFKGKSIEEILAGFEISDSIPGLIEFEEGMRAKVGPMSIMKPFSEREEGITEYYTLGDVEAEPLNPQAIKAVVKEWTAISGIRQQSRFSTIREMKLSTNSGAPYFMRRSTVINKPDPGLSPVAVLGWRGQEGGPSDDDVKQRGVFMFPFEVNVKELSVYKPIIKGLQAHKLVPALVSSDEVDNRVTLLFDTKDPSDDVVATDFSTYDHTFNKTAQAASRQIWSELGVDEAWLDNVFPIKFNIPLVCTESVTLTGSHGMGSGSGGTNTDECAEHRALQHEAAIEAGQTLNKNSMAYGDDGILSFSGISVDHVIQTYTKHGHIMNKEKQYVSKNSTTFLRRYYHSDYRPDGIMRGIYSIYRALGRIHFLERFYDSDKWNSNLLILRTLSIIENCKWHPDFKKLIDYVLTGDKLRLGLSVPGFYDVKRLSKEARKAREALGDDFLGYTKTQMSVNKQKDAGINDWEVVKYLRTKL